MSKKALEATEANGLQSYVDDTKKSLDSLLLKVMHATEKLRLSKQIEYVLKTQGKRLRSTLVMLSGESVGGEKQNLQNLALAIELLHTATLVHDDILDQDLFRRNVLSAYAKWSIKEAILVGDALASLALGLCRGYSNEILHFMASTCLQLSDGEYMDVQLTDMEISEKEYFEKVRKNVRVSLAQQPNAGELLEMETLKKLML